MRIEPGFAPRSCFEIDSIFRAGVVTTADVTGAYVASPLVLADFEDDVRLERLTLITASTYSRI